ncbi:aminoacyl-tRNA hydrolase [bacterium]|nr:aminoacyl-tRNA hydrolase [bacterium]MBT4634347.1 aminoacyl-tRNA hydrolase [bacterium]
MSPMLPKKKVTNNNIALIVGLGNPGEKYESTRHNIGFSFIDKFSEQINSPITDSKFNSLYSNVNKDGKKLLLLKPQTYMNDSGVAVKKVKDFFKISSNQTIVIYDDLDLQVGQIKIKDTGGSGGHNGINSIIENIGNNNFIRIRIGIGKPLEKSMTNKYVLSKFTKDESKIVNNINNLAKNIIYSIVFKSISFAMNTFNSKIQ